MNDELKTICLDFSEKVKLVCLLMLKAFNLRNKLDLYKFRSSHMIGEFDFEGNNKYFFHGRGCLFSNKDIRINWDFGYGSRWCGFDPWFIANYLKDNNIASQYIDGNKVKQEFE